MSRGLTNSGVGLGAHRDYGAISTSTNVPDVSFAGFSPTEFISLSENVAQNIGFVKSQWRALDKELKLIGTPRDNQQTRDKVHKIQIETNKKITLTSKDLQRLTAIVRGGDKQQKLQVEKLTSDFKIIVEKYSASQQQIATKMKAILLTNASQNDDIMHDTNSGDANIDMSQVNAQKNLQQNIQFEQDLLVEREKRMEQIEADILDVNQIMKELSALVYEQGETLDTITANVENVAVDVEEGTSQLIQAAASQKKYRRKVIILLIIAVIIGLIVTGIIVSQLKS